MANWGTMFASNANGVGQGHHLGVENVRIWRRCLTALASLGSHSNPPTSHQFLLCLRVASSLPPVALGTSSSCLSRHSAGQRPSIHPRRSSSPRRSYHKPTLNAPPLPKNALQSHLVPAHTITRVFVCVRGPQLCPDTPFVALMIRKIHTYISRFHIPSLRCQAIPRMP